MQAFQLIEWQQPPVLRDVPVPEPGTGLLLGFGLGIFAAFRRRCSST